MRSLRDTRDAIIATAISTTVYGLPICLALLSGPRDAITNIEIAPEPERVVTISWDLATGGELDHGPAAEPTGESTRDREAAPKQEPEPEQQVAESKTPTPGETEAADAPALADSTLRSADGRDTIADIRAARRASIAPTPSQFGDGDSTDDGSAGRAGKCDVDHPEIIQLGENHWKVDRSIVDYYTSSLARFNTLGWSREFDREGTNGWQVGGFGCRSPLYEGGLRARDVVLSIDKIEITSVPRIFRAWTKVRNDKEVVVKVMRKGVPVTLTYTLAG